MNYGNIDKSNIITPSDMELKIIEENKKEELKDYMKDSITRKKERDFLLERDTKVVEGYSHNFLPYNKREFDTDDKYIEECSKSDNYYLVRRSIVASKHIAEGEVLTAENITTKRAGHVVLEPNKYWDVLGTNAKRVFKKNDFIEL